GGPRRRTAPLAWRSQGAADGDRCTRRIRVHRLLHLPLARAACFSYPRPKRFVSASANSANSTDKRARRSSASFARSSRPAPIEPEREPNPIRDHGGKQTAEHCEWLQALDAEGADQQRPSHHDLKQPSLEEARRAHAGTEIQAVLQQNEREIHGPYQTDAATRQDRAACTSTPDNGDDERHQQDASELPSEEEQRPTRRDRKRVRAHDESRPPSPDKKNATSLAERSATCGIA